MNRKYPLNCWYVAATADEVSGTPFRRTIVDEPVVLYRTESGSVVSLRDRCAHRGSPLSQGRIDRDRIVCGYHGFTYDASGACVEIPSQAHVPAGTRVHGYPVHEAGPFVWIWPGDPAAAALTAPPELPWLTEPSWTHFGGSAVVEANYVLLHEHHLDITHIWVGRPDLTPSDLGGLPPINEVEVSETSVNYRRSQPPQPLADWEALATGLDRTRRYPRCDTGTFVSPGLHVLRWELDGGQKSVFRHVRIQAFTPESPTRTHVFWRAAYDYATDRPNAIHQLRSVVADIDDRDRALVEAVQRNAGDAEWGADQVNILADTAGLRARRIIKAMIAKEAGPSPIRPGFQP